MQDTAKAAAAASGLIAPSEVRLRPLRSAADIAGVQYLREALDLPPSVRNDPAFIAREKKRPVGGGLRV